MNEKKGRKNLQRVCFLIFLLAPLLLFLKMKRDTDVILNQGTLLPMEEMSRHRVRKIQLKDLDLAYLDEGHGSPVVLLHGFPDLASTYDETISVLAQRGYRVIAPFLPGYYPSGFLKNSSYSPATIARVMKTFLEALELDRVVMVGHDWGATITYAYASLFPKSLDQMVTIAIPPPQIFEPSLRMLWKAEHFAVFQWGLIARWYTSRDHFHYLDDLVSRWAPHLDPGKMRLPVFKKTLVLKGRLQAALAYYESMGEKSEDHLFQRPFQVPGLMIAGNEDLLDLDVYQRLSEAFAAPVKFEPFLGAGHFIHLEQPAKFHETLFSFLEEKFDGPEDQ